MPSQHPSNIDFTWFNPIFIEVLTELSEDFAYFHLPCSYEEWHEQVLPDHVGWFCGFHTDIPGVEH